MLDGRVQSGIGMNSPVLTDACDPQESHAQSARFSLDSCSSVARNCRGLACAPSAALRLQKQTRIRFSLILSAQLYSEAVRIFDIKTVRARLHFQTATLQLGCHSASYALIFVPVGNRKANVIDDRRTW